MEARFLKQFDNMRKLTIKKYHEPNKHKQEYERLSKNTRNLARAIVGPNVSERNLLVRAYNASYNKVTPATVKIQRALRKRRVNTNETFMKMMNRFRRGNNRNVPRMTNFASKKYGTENLNLALNMIYEKRHKGASPAVTKIQSVVRGYQSRQLTPTELFVMQLRNDRRFKYYVPVLMKLFLHTSKTLRFIKNNPTYTPQNIISGAIGVCHIQPDQVPAKYLGAMRSQLVYVAHAYLKMDRYERKKYRDRLYKNLGDRPCLENTLEALIVSLVDPVFEWTGKGIEPPLVKNNARYLNNVMAKAMLSWASKKPKGLPNNLNARKQMFWHIVKNRELHVRNAEGIPMYTTVSRYNVNGNKFKSSLLANALGNL